MDQVRKFLGWSVVILIATTFVWSFAGYSVPMILWGLNLFFLLASFGLYVATQGLLVYVLKRVGEAAVVLWIVASLTFLLLRLLPGGPFDTEKALPPQVKANIEAKYHLDKPLHLQYFYFMSGLARGELGESYKFLGRSATDIIMETLPNSFQLGCFALVVSFLIGIPAGVLAAARHNTWLDAFMMMGSISGVSLPSFLVAPIVILIFCFGLEIFPPAFWDGPEYYILPVLTLGVRPAAVIARLTRASVLEVINSDYIRTARAKGLNERTVLFKHVLKNSLIPVLTFSGPLAAGILSGSFIIEIIFAIPGMGKHLVQSVSNRDYPLILGTALVFSFMLVVANLIVDLLYSYFDPRIKLS